MFQKDIAAMNEAASERAAAPRAILEGRLDEAERRIAVLESSVRLLAAAVRRASASASASANERKTS